MFRTVFIYIHLLRRFTCKLQSQRCINVAAALKNFMYFQYVMKMPTSASHLLLRHKVSSPLSNLNFLPLDEGLNLGLRYKNFFCIMWRPQKA